MRILRYVTLGVLIHFIQWDSRVLAQTSRYFPFPTSNAYWRLTEYDSSAPTGVEISDYQIYYFGDTFYNGKVIHILNMIVEHAINKPWHSSGERRFGYLWQDTLQKIVYFKDWLSLTCNTCDSVLYDFNMEIGDSLINSSYFVSHMLYSYVYAIDSILIDGLYRKRFVLEDGNHFPSGVEIIEGIGSNLGGFYQYNYFEQLYILNCFNQNGNVFYNQPGYICTELIADLNPKDIENIEPVIYPNPVVDYFNIRSDKAIRQICLLSIDGRPIIKEKFDDNSSEVTIKINNNYSKGIYYVIINTDSGVFQNKICIN